MQNRPLLITVLFSALSRTRIADSKPGSRDVVSHVVRQNDVIFEFQSALNPGNQEMGDHLVKHGDGVKDIAFSVENIDFIVSKAKSRGALVVKDVHQETDEFGSVRLATVQTFGDTTHTFVERSAFNGLYLPNYKKIAVKCMETTVYYELFNLLAFILYRILKNIQHF